MIFRNSIKSILRTPVKTLSFALLIAAVAAFLYLGVNTWAASAAMLRDCEENYTTIVTLEYLEDYGSNLGSKSQTMLAEVAGIDFDAIAANENVLLWQPADEGMAAAAGFVSNEKTPEYSYAGVFIVRGLRPYAPDSPYHGELVESLYSFRPYEPGRSLFVERYPDDYGFDPDPDATYVIHITNNRVNTNSLSVQLSPFYSWIAQQAGVDSTSIAPFQQIESAEALHGDEDSIYLAIANYYNAMNNALTVCRARELGELEEFHQNYLQPVSGRLFTRQEAEQGAKVCVISEMLANDRGLKVGDTLTINLPDDEGATLYTWGDRMSREENLTVVGIVNHHPDYKKNIYTPPLSDSPRPVRYRYDLGQATIKNGTAEAFLAQIQPLLPEHVFIAVYDQGYQATADALKVIQNAAIALSVIAFAVALAVLAFFAYLFTDAQKDAVEIMRCFGGKKTEVRLYLMIGAGLTALVAIGAGILVGTGFAENLMERAYAFVSELQVVDMRFSDGFRGIIKTFTPVVTLSYALAGAVGGGIFLFSLGLCLYFAERTVSGRLITARARVRVRRAPKKSSVALSGALRHALLSIRRSPGRSLLVPVLCGAALLFVASLQATLVSYDSARTSLYENTQLRGYGAQMNGKFSDRLSIQNTHAQKILDMEHLSGIAYTYTFNYGYLGIPQRGDGSAGQVKPVPSPRDPYEAEVLNDMLAAGPNIIFTDSVRGAPEFYFGEFHADFMPGWDEARFAGREWETLPCIVTGQFMGDHGIKPGDHIRIYMQDAVYNYGFYEMDMLVVGSFTRAANQNNIYCPLPLGALDPAASTLNELNFVNYTLKTGEYFEAAMRFSGYQSYLEYTQQQMLDMMLDMKYVTSLTFGLEDPHRLGEVKDALEEVGFSGPTMANDIRVCLVIEDAQFNETLSSLTQRSKYLEILYPVLLALTCILGLITGFLAVKSRREDIALMRGMGMQKRRIFATIFGEQLLLLLLGALPAAGIWYVREGAAQLVTPGIYAFFVCYGGSVALAILMQNAKRALSILSEKE